MKIVITGNSNSGKTTLFNNLSNSSESVGNWHGVTVSVKSKKYKIDKKEIEFIDLPGLQSFETYTLEENVSVEFLKKGDYDLIINVIEALRFDTAILLTKELSRLNKPMLCIVNMNDDLTKKGGYIDYKTLSLLCNNFYDIDVTKRKDIKRLKELIIKDIENINSLKNVDFMRILSCYYEPRKIFFDIDKVLVKKRFCLPIFSLIILLSFYLAFGDYGLGKPMGTLLSNATELFGNFVSNRLMALSASEFTIRLITCGIIKGISSLVGILPSILVLSFVLRYLEHSGLIARFSFLFDNFLGKFGLNGRALFSLIMGFGCTAVSVNTTNGLENKGVKKRLVFALPCVSCSAKTPVYFYLLQTIFADFSFIFVYMIYFAGVIISLFISMIMSKFESDKKVALIMELPILRLNCLKNIRKPLINSVKQFIIKISTVIVSVSVTIFLLSTLGSNFEYLPKDKVDESILAFLGRKVTYIFKPIGIDDYKVGTAVLSGLFAKEAIISTLEGLSFSLDLSTNSLIALVVFIAFYPPCFTALFAIKSQIGISNSIFLFVFQTLLSLILSYIIYFVLSFPISIFPLIIIPLAFCILHNMKAYHENFSRKRKN